MLLFFPNKLKSKTNRGRFLKQYHEDDLEKYLFKKVQRIICLFFYFLLIYVKTAVVLFMMRIYVYTSTKNENIQLKS